MFPFRFAFTGTAGFTARLEVKVTVYCVGTQTVTGSETGFTARLEVKVTALLLRRYSCQSANFNFGF